MGTLFPPSLYYFVCDEERVAKCGHTARSTDASAEQLDIFFLFRPHLSSG